MKRQGSLLLVLTLMVALLPLSAFAQDLPITKGGNPVEETCVHEKTEVFCTPAGAQRKRTDIQKAATTKRKTASAISVKLSFLACMKTQNWSMREAERKKHTLHWFCVTVARK